MMPDITSRAVANISRPTAANPNPMMYLDNRPKATAMAIIVTIPNSALIKDSHSIEPSVLTRLVMIANAPAIITNPVAAKMNNAGFMYLDKSANALTISVSPPIAAPAFPSSPHSIFANFLATSATISIAADIITKATEAARIAVGCD